MDNYFARLNQINVSEHIERKGDFAYLSWPFAVAQLRLADPAAFWEVRRFDGLPYLRTETGYFVEVAVTVQGVTLSQIHPVLDGRNRPISEPTAFDINTSIQRCLVKAIALHGLGLYIYAGEDLPAGESTNPVPIRVPTEPTRVTPIQNKNERVITPAQLGFLKRLIREAKSSEDHVKDFFNLDRLEDLAMKDFDRALASLRRAA
jgi:Protein of unknown function (DUF1071)